MVSKAASDQFGDPWGEGLYHSQILPQASEASPRTILRIGIRGRSITFVLYDTSFPVDPIYITPGWHPGREEDLHSHVAFQYVAHNALAISGGGKLDLFSRSSI